MKPTVESFHNKHDSQAEIAQDVGTVRYLQNGLAAYHIMNYLTSGLGTGAWDVWDPLLTDVGTDLPIANRAAWMARPPWIALAHELIHAWRLASGRCVFRPSLTGGEYYYEQAMTVGLPPYDQCRCTENRFRNHKGQALRTFDAETTRSQSARAMIKHGSVGARVMIKVVGGGLEHAAAQVTSDGEIRFGGLGALGRVEA